jgi:hypothetical protein
MASAYHIESGQARDPESTIDRIFTVMDENKAVAAADRLQAGFGLRVVK